MNYTDAVDFEIRNGPGGYAERRLYTLPSRFIYFELLIYILIFCLFVFGWFPSIVSILRYGIVLPSAQRAAVFLNITAVLLFLFYLFVKREMRLVAFILTDDSLIFKTSQGSNKISFPEIRSVSFKRFSVFGGFLIVNSYDETISIPMMLLKISDLIERLEHAYRKAAGSSVVPDTMWRDIQKAGLISESAARRSTVAFKPLLSISGIIVPASVFIGALYWDMPAIPLLLLSVSSAIFPLCSYAVSDLIIRRHEAMCYDKNTITAERFDHEKVYVWTGLVSLLIYLFAGTIYKILIIN